MSDRDRILLAANETELTVVEPFRLEWRRREPRSVTQGHLTIRPLLVGVCGTDLEIVRGSYPRVRPPAVIGHEWVGQVIRDDDQSTVKGRYAPERLVVGYNYVGDPDGGVREIGFELPGAIASRITLPGSNLITAPAGVAVEDLVLAEPTAVIAHVMARIPHVGQSTVVIGDGPIGLIAAVILRDAGHSVTVIGRTDSRMDQITGLGILVIPSAQAEEGLLAEPIDTIIEASGSVDAVELALRLLREYGTLVLVGAYLGKSVSEFGLIGDKNLSVVGVNTGNGYLPAAVDYIARGVVTASTVGVTFVNRACAPSAIASLARSERNDMKMVVDLRS